MNFLNKKIIAGILGGLVVIGGITFAFRDQFLSSKSLWK